jgi:hypothetical protein
LNTVALLFLLFHAQAFLLVGSVTLHLLLVNLAQQVYLV